MSNCDGVLDNWEDIDADKLNVAFSNLNTSTSCNNIDVLGELTLDEPTVSNSKSSETTTAMQILQRSCKEDDVTSICPTASTDSLMNSANIQTVKKSTSNNYYPVTMVLHKPDDEYQSANYTAPIVNQTVKILRRPIQAVEPRVNEVRIKQPLKSLKQREQEYAEARLRIMGVAKNPEDDCIDTCNATQTTTSISTVMAPNSAAQSVSSNVTANSASKTSSPRNQSGGGALTAYNNIYNQQHKQQPLITQLPHQIQQPLPPQSQVQQYQHNFHFNPQSYYYAFQQQSLKSVPTYNNNQRTQSIPLLAVPPPPHLNILSGQNGNSVGCISGCGPVKTQYMPSSAMPPNYQQQQHQQQQLHLQQHPSYQSKILTPPQFQSSKSQQAWSPVVGGKVSFTPGRQQQLQQMSQTQQSQTADNVLRLPRGPDGTCGFQIRR